ncbi:MAG: DUF309 domain-containing protein [Pseudomonadota bacterium]
MSGAAALPLPACKHRPGENARPTDGFLEDIAHSAPEFTDPEQHAENVAWQYGVRLIDNGYYWEAHEVLEPVWFRCPEKSRERFFIQALIQYANACLKAEMGRHNATRRLAVIDEELLFEA